MARPAPPHQGRPYQVSPNPPKGYGGGVDTGDDGYGKANGPGPVPIDGVEGSGRWPRQWPGGGRQWRRPAKTARRHAGSGTGGLGWHEFAGQPLGLSGGRVGRRRRAVRLAGEGAQSGQGATELGFWGRQGEGVRLEKKRRRVTSCSPRPMRGPAGQVMRHHLDGQPGGVGGETAREMVERRSRMAFSICVATMVGLRGCPRPDR